MIAQPYMDARWKVVYPDITGQPVTHYLTTDAALYRILRYQPTAEVTNLQRIDCDACEGSCDGSCDAGNGTAWERLIEERTGRTVSEQRGVSK